MNTYLNLVDVYSGNIFADRNYQVADIQDGVKNIKQVIQNGVNLHDWMTCGSWPLYGTFGRTNNGFSVEITNLTWSTTNPAITTVGIRVQNGNLTENRGGSRYVSGANRLQEAHNYTYVDMANEIAAVNLLEKDGPGVLAIDKVNGGINMWMNTNLLAHEGVLRLGSALTLPHTFAAGLGVDVRADAAVGIGWNTPVDLSGLTFPPPLPPNTPFTITPGSAVVGSIIGQVGAVDIDQWNHNPAPAVIDTNIWTALAGWTYLRVGSSMGADADFDPHPLAAKHASTLATIYPYRFGTWEYLLGGGGGTLEIDSQLNNFGSPVTSLQMGTTGTLLPGRITLAPVAGFNGYAGNTDIAAGTLQLIPAGSINFTALVNLSTYDKNITNGLYANPAPGYSWTGPGQLLLEAGMAGANNWDLNWYTANGGLPLKNWLTLNGGIIGWTSNVLVTGVPGTYGPPITSDLNPAVSPFVNVLGLGGEYSAGTMITTFQIKDNIAAGSPVLLYKAGKNSILNLRGFAGPNLYTGGTIIAGGEIQVNDAKQLNAEVGGNGGPICILNGGRLHILVGGADTNFIVPIKVNTSGTPDPIKNCGSVIDVEPGVTATLKANFDFAWKPTAYLEKDGSGTLAYVAPAPTAVAPGPGATNAWGLKLTAGLVTVNQMPVNPGAAPLYPGADSGPVIFNNGNLEVTQVPAGMVWDKNPAYGFRNIVSFQNTISTVTVDDNAMFRTHGIVPNEILGRVIFVANDLDGTPSDNVVDLSRNMAPAGAASMPSDFSHGNGTLSFSGVTVFMSGGGLANDLNVLPRDVGFTLELKNGVVFNASSQNNVYGAVIFNTSSTTSIKIDAENANATPSLPIPPYYQFGVNPTTWSIFGTGLTSWNGTTEKIGQGTIQIMRAQGAPVVVDPSTLLKISGGTFEAGGTADPFTDTSTSLSLDILNNSTLSGLLISQGVKNVDTITGTGNTTLSGTGTKLTVTSIAQNTVTLGAGCTLTIRPLPGGPTAAGGITPVPEPATWLLLVLAAAGLSIWPARNRLFRSGER